MNWKLAYLRHAVNHWRANVCYLGECNDTLFIGITGAYFWLLDFYSMCAKHFIWDIVCSERCDQRGVSRPTGPRCVTVRNVHQLCHVPYSHHAGLPTLDQVPPLLLPNRLCLFETQRLRAHTTARLTSWTALHSSSFVDENALMHLIPKRSQVMWSDGVEQPNDQHCRCRVRYLYKSA